MLPATPEESGGKVKQCLNASGGKNDIKVKQLMIIVLLWNIFDQYIIHIIYMMFDVYILNISIII